MFATSSNGRVRNRCTRSIADEHWNRLTWGIFALSWRFKASRSFSTSANRASISCSRSWCSRIDSIILSRSSSICTISCSIFPSSPENCELRWLMLSSAIVGITSHIIFHILHVVRCCRRRHGAVVLRARRDYYIISLLFTPRKQWICGRITGELHARAG